jgi:putative ABC transport system substrate-binding protein
MPKSKTNGDADTTAKLLVVLLAFASAATAQAVRKVAHVGMLCLISCAPAPITNALSDELRKLGWVEGTTIVIERKEAGGRFDRLPALAADLVRRQVTVIVTVGINSSRAAKAATQTIPVVFGMSYDPVASGVVASLNRPSGNLTGVTSVGYELAGKRLELLHKLVPAADPIAYLGRTVPVGGLTNLQTAAHALGVRLLTLVGATESEITAAFATIVEQRAGALLISAGAFSPAAFDQQHSGRASKTGHYAVRCEVALAGGKSVEHLTGDLVAVVLQRLELGEGVLGVGQRA